MADEITVPRLGWSMEEGTFVEWLKRDGALVRAGEPLFAIEGDKAIQEVESLAEGTLRISPSGPEHGETVKVGAVLGFLVGPNEPDPFGVPALVRPPTAGAPIGQSAVQPAAKRDARTVADGPKISPRAARVAAELEIDYRRVEGTGRNGRIRERDVRRAAGGTAQRSEALPSFRRTIAARMAAGAQSTAPVTLTTTADATNLVALRLQFKNAAKSIGGPIPGYTDMVVKLAAGALARHPDLNQQWVDGRIVRPDSVDVAVAVDTPAGLVAPVVRDVLAVGLRDLAARSAELKSRALGAQLSSAELAGGTFTVSNLGAFGIDAFTPIISVPQCAVLGMGRIDRRPAVVGEQIVPRDVITLSLTFDHRIVDGAPAARFLATLREAIENPGPWLVF